VRRGEREGQWLGFEGGNWAWLDSFENTHDLLGDLFGAKNAGVTNPLCSPPRSKSAYLKPFQITLKHNKKAKIPNLLRGLVYWCDGI
jgi:hypothetical protein